MLSITELEKLPKISGIYKVLDSQNNVIYVGQAKNIYERWNKGHHQLSKIIKLCGTNAYIEWIEVPEWLLNRAENTAICFYQPPLNKKNSPVV